MIKTGIVSVTFRKKTTDEIIEITQKAGLDAIEWGGDLHVPPNDLQNAITVGKKTRAAGLTTASYGSYYRVGAYDNYINAFTPVLDTAKALEAENIRVWAGVKGSAETDPAARRKIEEESFLIAEKARESGITVSYECHGGTLTDSLESYISLLNNVKNTYAYFQPAASMPLDIVYDYLEKLDPYLLNLHVFNWERSNGSVVRLPLKQGEAYWREIFKKVNSLSDKKHYGLLEFVRDESDSQFIEDALSLKDFLN